MDSAAPVTPPHGHAAPAQLPVLAFSPAKRRRLRASRTTAGLWRRTRWTSLFDSEVDRSLGNNVQTEKKRDRFEEEPAGITDPGGFADDEHSSRRIPSDPSGTVLADGPHEGDMIHLTKDQYEQVLEKVAASTAERVAEALTTKLEGRLTDLMSKHEGEKMDLQVRIAKLQNELYGASHQLEELEQVRLECDHFRLECDQLRAMLNNQTDSDEDGDMDGEDFRETTGDMDGEDFRETTGDLSSQNACFHARGNRAPGDCRGLCRNDLRLPTQSRRHGGLGQV